VNPEPLIWFSIDNLLYGIGLGLGSFLYITISSSVFIPSMGLLNSDYYLLYLTSDNCWDLPIALGPLAKLDAIGRVASFMG